MSTDDDLDSADKADPNVRLLALSDGVIAVAITLLVLDIRLPDGAGRISDAELWGELVALWPRFFSYLLSFAVIMSFWQSHRAKLNRIMRTDAGLIWINALFLLTIGLVPFTTNLIAENSGALATAIYASTMVISGLSLAWLWGHASRGGLLDAKVTKEEFRRGLQTTLVVAAVFAVSVPLSIAHSDFAKLFWLLTIPVNFLFRWLAVRRWQIEHPGEPMPTRSSRRVASDAKRRD